MTLLATIWLPTRVWAQVPDVFYGRMRGDMVLSVEGAAGAVALSNNGIYSCFSVVARARFMDIMGVGAGYDRSLGPERWDALWLAADLRPTFAARVNFDMQHGPQWLDLMIDSIGMELGVAWIRLGEALGRGGGLGLVLGAGVEFPLRWRRGNALMLRLGSRWVSSSPWDVQGTGRYDEHALQVTIGLVYRAMAHTGLIGAH